jgi:hypothetical protein
VARPQKSGLDYFSLDVVMSDEVEIIEAEYGLEGFAILIKLYQKIYSEGYYYQWGDKEQILFSNRVSVDRNRLTTIVDDCVKWGLFDEKLYKNYNILTSRRIQNQYFSATYKRTGVEAIEQYLLIDITDRDNVATTRVSDIGNSPTTDISDSKSTQSKVKKSIKDKSIKDMYGEFQKVKLTEEEHSKLISRLGEIKTRDLIDRLDNYKESTGKSYKSDYATILNWHRREVKDESGANKSDGGTKTEGDDLAKRAGVTSL